MNSGCLCECHMLSQNSINVNWEIQHASMLCKPNMSFQICCTKVCLDGHSNMLKLVHEVFYPEVWRIICHIVVFPMDNNPGYFEEILRENVVVRYFTPNVTSWKQPNLIFQNKKWYTWTILPTIFQILSKTKKLFIKRK